MTLLMRFWRTRPLFRPPDLASFIENTVRVARTGGDVAVFMPSVGSFGEVFSMLWEALFTEELTEHAAGVEKLVAELPTSSHLEKLASDAGMVNINTQTTVEVFDFEDGAAFTASPLVSGFPDARVARHNGRK